MAAEASHADKDFTRDISHSSLFEVTQWECIRPAFLTNQCTVKIHRQLGESSARLWN